MAIENRQLEAGTKLVARYKGTDYVATVTADGKYTMDGKEYGSPSAAGSAVMDGKACNGWRFWSIEGTQPAPRERKAKEPKAPKEPKAAKGKTKSTTVVQIKKSRKQETCPEGEVHWFCSACMKGFCQPTGVTPDVCPEGRVQAALQDRRGRDQRRPGRRDRSGPGGGGGRRVSSDWQPTLGAPSGNGGRFLVPVKSLPLGAFTLR